MNNLEIFEICNPKVFDDNCTIHLMLTDACNINCSYCYNQVKGNTYFTMNMFTKLVKFVRLQEKSEIDFSLIGGEPTLNPHLRSYLLMLNLWEVPIVITTNLMKSLEYFKSLLVSKRIEYTCSLHNESISSFKNWFEKVEYLHDNGMLQQVSMMLTKDNIDVIKFLYEKYKDKYPLKVFPINQFRVTQQYEDLLKEGLFEKYSPYEEAIQSSESTKQPLVRLKDGTDDSKNYDKYSDFRSMMCNAGFVVSASGDVCKCFSMMHKPILNLNDPLKKLNRWGICGSNSCGCDFEYSKYSIMYWNERYAR